MSKELFKPGNVHGNAHVGYVSTIPGATSNYASCYRNAALHLTEQIENSYGYNDHDACPIVFLFRHSIELYLKSVILSYINFLAFAEVNTDKVSKIKKTLKTHKLNELLKHVEDAFLYFYNELPPEDLLNLIDTMDITICSIRRNFATDNAEISKNDMERLQNYTAEIDPLLGSSIRPNKWRDFLQLLYSDQKDSFDSIEKTYWQNIKKSLMKNVYDKNDPIQIDVKDLNEIINLKPSGPIVTKLKWEVLDDDTFERLIFTIISGTNGYENPEWLMKTNATDRGRDLSVIHVVNDPLLGIVRKKMIIQCKHWQRKSISIDEISKLKEQMRLWEPPKVDTLVIATSGRFTVDAVRRLKITMNRMKQ